MTAITSKQCRLMGLGGIVIGAILLGIFLGWPLYQAKSGAQEITINSKLITIGGLFIIMGLNVLLFGLKALDLFVTGATDLKKITIIQWIILVINVGVITTGFLFLKFYMEDQGYTESYKIDKGTKSDSE